MINLSTLPPLSLYVHLPWCVRKCPYCDFNSHEVKDSIPEQDYVNCLLLDLEQELPQVWGRHVSSIFIGGGTPSLFSGEAIDRLLAGIRARVPLHPGLEITLEANPGTVDANHFAGYLAAGVNRLSIGIQSFDNEKLKSLGRIHDSTMAIQAIQTAVATGFENINLDLMFGLPHQDDQAMMKDLQQAIALGPTHISHYQLTIEPNTLFYQQPPALPDDDRIFQAQRQCRDLLASAGYGQYEVSAFAQAGKQCRHNLNYWRFGDYIGIGAGAHGKISHATTGIRRYSKIRHPKEYLGHKASADFIQTHHTLVAQDLSFEFMLNALRLYETIPLSLFSERTGVASHTIGPVLQKADDLGWLHYDQDRISTTENGKRFLNDVVELFLPGNEND
jgi:putative oxygen-independent coproporphyrinogen III oxidase